MHKGVNSSGDLNKGIFILGLIEDIINQTIKYSKGKEYYKNGKLKYEGDFVNDVYEGDGKYFYENDDVYIGQFKNGKPNGDGCFIRNGSLLYEGKFQNGIYISSKYEEENTKKEFKKTEYQIKKYPNPTLYTQKKEDFSTMIYKGFATGIGKAIGDFIGAKLFGKH